jgi:hypothetical protein
MKAPQALNAVRDGSVDDAMFSPDQPQTAVFSCLKYRLLKRVPAIHYTRGFLSRSIRHLRCESMTMLFAALLPRAATGSTDQTICG